MPKFKSISSYPLSILWRHWRADLARRELARRRRRSGSGWRRGAAAGRDGDGDLLQVGGLEWAPAEGFATRGWISEVIWAPTSCRTRWLWGFFGAYVAKSKNYINQEMEQHKGHQQQNISMAIMHFCMNLGQSRTQKSKHPNTNPRAWSNICGTLDNTS